MSSENIKGTANLDESFHTVVVGGGQAGLAVGYFLARQGENFVILDENPRTGASWRKRWESLKLFTPSKFNGLPGRCSQSPVIIFQRKTKLLITWKDMSNNSTWRCGTG